MSSLGGCKKCGKPTRSHRLGNGYFCHECFTHLSEESLKQFKSEAIESETDISLESIFALSLLAGVKQNRKRS